VLEIEKKIVLAMSDKQAIGNCLKMMMVQMLEKDQKARKKAEAILK
jgi:hypothetical protein